jgi:hypothetical protein
MDNQERQDLNKIRHYKGTIADFKSYWDEMAGKNTNAYDTPEYQGFDNVHPTRGAKQSPHWKTSNLTEQDHEVSMAQKLLAALIDDALDLQEKLGNLEKDIPGWIQDHISQAYNYLKQANDGYHELD